jgi:hypothetical protein
MRGRILVTTMTIVAGAALIAACSKRDSLFIEPGKAEASPSKKSVEKPPPKAAEAPPKA